MNIERQIVSDTGPLISLEKLTDDYRFIRRLYERILIPPTVLEELYQGQFGRPEAYLTYYDVADLLDGRGGWAGLFPRLGSAGPG